MEGSEVKLLHTVYCWLGIRPLARGRSSMTDHKDGGETVRPAWELSRCSLAALGHIMLKAASSG